MKKLRIISIILIMCCGIALIYPAVIAKKEYDVRVVYHNTCQKIIDDVGDNNNTWANEIKEQEIGERDNMISFIVLIALAVVFEAAGAAAVYMLVKECKVSKKTKVVSLIVLLCCGLILIYPSVVAKNEYDYRVEVYTYNKGFVDNNEDTGYHMHENAMIACKAESEDCMTALIFIISIAVVVEAVGAANLYLTFKKKE